MTAKTDVDVIVVGSGPNGLAAAITLQQNGLQVLILEAHDQIGGGMRTKSLTLPSFRHDVCSAVHPMAMISPFFKSLPLSNYGLEYLFPPNDLAHPFDDRTSAVLTRSVFETAQQFGSDASFYQKLIGDHQAHWEEIMDSLLNLAKIPSSDKLLKYLSFGSKALTSASFIARFFSDERLKAFWAGMAAHSIQSLSNLATSAIALVLLGNGHHAGWPIPVGGSQSIADALAGYFQSIGGRIEVGCKVDALGQLPSTKAVVFDVGPKQLLKIAGHKFSSLYNYQLNRYRYGMGIFKIDWALSDAIPFTNESCYQAGTVHIGNSFAEIYDSESTMAKGKISSRPFVILSQPSVFDPTRAPSGKHVAWGYCHVPNGSTTDMSDAIERQIERFAPGFKECIMARHTMDTQKIENYNANYVGGDINSGQMSLSQIFTRPALRSSPYRTSTKGLYMCSAATPPGPGVHGMGGFNCARQVLKDIFS